MQDTLFIADIKNMYNNNIHVCIKDLNLMRLGNDKTHDNYILDFSENVLFRYFFGKQYIMSKHLSVIRSILI